MIALDLPPELFEQIIFTLTQSDTVGIRNLRLVCRQFSTLCLSHIVRHIALRGSKPRFQSLLSDLARNPCVAPLVKSLEVVLQQDAYWPLIGVLEQLSQLQSLKLTINGDDAELYPLEEDGGRLQLPALCRVQVECNGFPLPRLLLDVLWGSVSHLREVSLHTTMWQAYSGAPGDSKTPRTVSVSCSSLEFDHQDVDVPSAFRILRCFSHVEETTLQLLGPGGVNIVAALGAVHGATLHTLRLIHIRISRSPGTYLLRSHRPPILRLTSVLFPGFPIMLIGIGAFPSLRELHFTWKGDAHADDIKHIGPFFSQLPVSKLTRISLNFDLDEVRDWFENSIDWAMVDRSLANTARYPALTVVQVSVHIYYFDGEIQRRAAAAKAHFERLHMAMPALHRRGMFEKVEVVCTQIYY